MRTFLGACVLFARWDLGLFQMSCFCHAKLKAGFKGWQMCGRSMVSESNFWIIAPFNNMRTLKFKAQPTNAFFATVNQMFGGSSQLPTTAKVLFRCLNYAQRFEYRALGSSRKLGGAAEHLIDGSKKHICVWSFECQSPHAIERRSNIITEKQLKWVDSYMQLL